MTKSLLISVGGGGIIAIIAGILTSSIPASLCTGFITFFLILLILFFSSKSPYMAAFGLILSAILALNIPTLKFMGKIVGFEIQYNMEDSLIDEITLGALILFAVILLFMENKNNPAKKAKVKGSKDAEVDQSGFGTKSAEIDDSPGAKIKQ